jgi:hypothetical protein
MTEQHTQPDDTYAPLEAGMRALLNTLGRGHPAYQEALVYEHRLRENVAFASTRGDTRDYGRSGQLWA